MGNPDRPDRRVVRHTDAIDEAVEHWKQKIMPARVDQTMAVAIEQLARSQDLHRVLAAKGGAELERVLERKWPEMVRLYLSVVDAGAVVKDVRGQVEASSAGIYTLAGAEVAISQTQVGKFAALLRDATVQLTAQTQQFIPENGKEPNIEEILERYATAAHRVTDGMGRLPAIRTLRDSSSVDLQVGIGEYLDVSTALNRLNTAVALRSASAGSDLSAKFMAKVAVQVARYGELTPEQRQFLLKSMDQAMIGTRTKFAALTNEFDSVLGPRAIVNLGTYVPPLSKIASLRQQGGPTARPQIALLDRFNRARPRIGTRGK